MGSKIGRDGREARWPIYEICPRKDKPKYHKSAIETGYFEPTKETKPVQRKILAVGWIWSVYPESPMDGLAMGLEVFETKYGKLPTAIAVDYDSAEGYTEIEYETLDGKIVEIPIQTNLVVMPTDVYFIIS